MVSTDADASNFELLEFALWFRRHFSKHYHSGKHLSDIQHSGEQVTGADETRDTADLLIGADGRTVRQRFLPDVHYRYAGYVAYRGLVETGARCCRSLTERFVFYQFPNSHILNM